MGLDIRGYKNVKKCENQEMFDSDGELLEEFDAGKYTKTYINQSYKERAEDIEDVTAYEYEDYFSLRAGSYSTYNIWRDSLARISGYDYTIERHIGMNPTRSYALTVWNNPIDGPFMELINFSDCEGIIGTSVCKKLLKDFIEYEDKAKEEGKYFYSTYYKIKKAFEYGAENGFVEYY